MRAGETREGVRGGEGERAWGFAMGGFRGWGLGFKRLFCIGGGVVILISDERWRWLVGCIALHCHPFSP